MCWALNGYADTRCGLCQRVRMYSVQQTQNSVTMDHDQQLTVEQIKHTIYGFLRQMHANDKEINIADLIIYLINAYYGDGYKYVDSHWDENLKGSSIKLYENKTRLKNEIKGIFSFNSAYCVYDIRVDHNLFEFCLIAEFKIDKIGGSSDDIYIGIEAKNWQQFNSNFASSKMWCNPFGIYWAYCSNGKIISHKKNAEKHIQTDRYKKNDKVYMKLRFVKDEPFGALYFSKNTEYSWTDTKFQITKANNMKIAVAVSSQSSLSLVSLKVKKSIDKDIYTKY